MSVEAQTDALKALLEAAKISDLTHVDLSHLFGGTHVRVGVTDLDEVLLATGNAPSLHLELGRAEVTVRNQNGGMVTTLEMTW